MLNIESGKYDTAEALMRLKLPFDIIKFDRSLVLASQSDKQSEEIVGRLTEMFAELNYYVLYEGVEDEKDEEILEVAKTRLEPYTEKVNEALENFSNERLVKGVTREMLDMTVGYTIKGLREKAYSFGEFDSEKYLSDIRDYFEMMKNIVYSNEG